MLSITEHMHELKLHFFCLSALHRISPPLMSITFGLILAWFQYVFLSGIHVDVQLEERLWPPLCVIVQRESTCWVWWGSISVFSWIVDSGRRLQRHLPVWSIRCVCVCVYDQITILNISLYSFVWLCHWLLWRWVTQDHLHNTCFCKTCFFFFFLTETENWKGRLFFNTYKIYPKI